MGFDILVFQILTAVLWLSLCLSQRCSLHTWLQPNRLPDMCIPSWENGLEVLIHRTACAVLLSSQVPCTKTFTLAHHTYGHSMSRKGYWWGDTVSQRSCRKNSSQLQTWRSDKPSHHLHHPVLFSEDFTSLMLFHVFLGRWMSSTFCCTDFYSWHAVIFVSWQKFFLYFYDW